MDIRHSTLSCMILLRFFQEAVLDVFNCVNVTLSRLLLEHNYGTGIVPLPYRGNTGGIAIGFNGLPPDPTASPRVELSHSILRNNSALATSHVISISSTAFSQVFTGRGGALGVFVNDSYNNVSVTITNCSIESNTARSFGGGAYFLFNGDTAQHSFAMDTTHFSSNVARLYGGGGVHLSFLSNGIPTAPHTVVFTDCQFHNNRAETGGGIYIFTSFLGIYVYFAITVFSIILYAMGQWGKNVAYNYNDIIVILLVFKRMQ